MVFAPELRLSLDPKLTLLTSGLQLYTGDRKTVVSVLAWLHHESRDTIPNYLMRSYAYMVAALFNPLKVCHSLMYNKHCRSIHACEQYRHRCPHTFAMLPGA